MPLTTVAVTCVVMVLFLFRNGSAYGFISILAVSQHDVLVFRGIECPAQFIRRRPQSRLKITARIGVAHCLSHPDSFASLGKMDQRPAATRGNSTFYCPVLGEPVNYCR